MTPLVEARELGLAARLFGASLNLAPGELVCLIGPNGSGKTSLLHALAGIGRPSGAVTIGGVDPWLAGPSERARLMTYLPASRDVLWPLVARDLIALSGDGPAVPEALDLHALMDRRVDTLSTGERSRVMLARAMAPRPALLLLDEPTANLDPLWQIRLMELLKDELREDSRAGLVAIHDLDAARRYADRIIVMDQGRIAAEGLDGPHIAEIFGIEPQGGEWVPVRPREDRRSSP